MAGQLESTRRYFNERAAAWDSHMEHDAARLGRLAARLELKAGMTVVDIGTGTGVLLPYILKSIGPRGHIIAIDIAHKMLLQARLNNAESNISCVCADVMALPLTADTCDAAVCYSSFPHFAHKSLALTEIRRVLKPGGKVFICHTSGREQINAIHHGIKALRDHLLPAAGEMTRLLTAAGFDDLAVEDSPDSYFAAGTKPPDA